MATSEEVDAGSRPSADPRQPDGAWYSAEGAEGDVVVSTRVRLARDLANFPFPARFRGDDAERVRSVVFDAFARCSEPERFQAVLSSNLDMVGRQILCERGVLEPTTPVSGGTGVVISTDGAFSCLVNDVDHVRLASFRAGLDGVGAFEECRRVDDELQSFLQFAASRERGFLTGRLADCGSGMKVSFRVHLPALAFTGRLAETVEELGRRGVGVRDCFGMSAEKTSALGGFYEVCTRTAGNGSEIDQMANAVGALRTLVETERRLSADAFEARPTEIRDRVYRAYAGAKFSLLCPARSAVEAVGAVKWGLNLGILGGISSGELSALVYRVQTGHIQFVMRSREFGFPADVARSRTLSENHIRALLMQEAFGRLTF